MATKKITVKKPILVKVGQHLIDPADVACISRLKRTREEHLKWCRERAIAEMDFYKDPTKGIVSMMSDLRKHPETNSDALISLCGIQLLTKPRMTRQEVIDFLNGFH